MDVVTAPQENRKPGVNPGRYRRCMRGGITLDESRSLGKPEKAVWSLGCVSQKNCLNEVKTLGSASTEPVVFCCRKTAAATLFVGLLQLFTFSAHQLNIAYWYGKVIRSESGTTVHCCVSDFASVREPAVSIGFITL